MQYAECLKNRYNAVDGTFYDAIKFHIIHLFRGLQVSSRIYQSMMTDNL